MTNAVFLIVAGVLLLFSGPSHAQYIHQRHPGFDTYGAKVDGADCVILGYTSAYDGTVLPEYGCKYTEEHHRRVRASVACREPDWLLQRRFYQADGEQKEMGGAGLFFPLEGCEPLIIPAGWDYYARIVNYSGGVFIRVDAFPAHQRERPSLLERVGLKKREPKAYDVERPIVWPVIPAPSGLKR